MHADCLRLQKERARPSGFFMKPYTRIEEAAEQSVPLFMSGLMSRDWQKALKALRDTAVRYHACNELQWHEKAKSDAFQFVPDDIIVIVSAALHAIEIQGNGLSA